MTEGVLSVPRNGQQCCLDICRQPAQLPIQLLHQLSHMPAKHTNTQLLQRRQALLLLQRLLLPLLLQQLLHGCSWYSPGAAALVAFG
jgi:hypothetical protein